MKKWLVFFFLAYIVSWKITLSQGDHFTNRREQKEFQTLREARAFARDLPGGTWDVRIYKKRSGRMP